MQITDMLAQMGGLQSIARELGISEAQAASGAAALAPAILGGFKKQAQAQPTGLEGLGGLLGRLGGGGLLDDVLAERRRQSAGRHPANGRQAEMTARRPRAATRRILSAMSIRWRPVSACGSPPPRR